MPLSNLKKTIQDFPKQFEKIATRGTEKKFSQTPKEVIVSGMGGSGLPAKLVQLFPAEVPIKARRNYAPKSFPAQSAVICISYSGNTEETLSCYHKARKQGLPLLAITTGGKLQKEAKEDGNLIEIPKTDIQPRWATGLLLGGLYLALRNSQILSQAPKKEKLQKLPQAISPSEFKKSGKDTAAFIKNKIPLIYTSSLNRPLGYYWKIAINENTKRHAFNNVFPEMNHNEIEGYKNKGQNFAPLIIKTKGDKPKIKKRMSKFEEVLAGRDIKTKSIQIEKENTWEKITSVLIRANWTVYYLAQKNNIDPEPVQLIEKFKKLMKD